MFINDMKKSISYILHERVTSPLYGAWFFSWIVFNWRIIYVTLFVSEDKLEIMKIDYIYNNYFSLLYLFVYPLLSAAFIIFLLPYISNFVYKHYLKRQEEKNIIKNEIENNKLLTIEESNKLRTSYLEMNNNFDKILKEKDNEIQKLKDQYKLLKEEYDNFKTEVIPDLNDNKFIKEKNENKWKEDFEIFYKNKNYNPNFIRVYIDLIKDPNIDLKNHYDLDYFIALGLIKKGEYQYIITDLGYKYYKEIKNRKAN